jgi:hypothetical protein
MRRFPANDVVILDGPRCDGQGHDGCKHGCRIFWREAWLRPVDAADATTERSEVGLGALRSRLKVKSDEQHYFCRGMGICDEVLRCCGGEAEVRYRVDRLIDERTGLMREISDTVTLRMRHDEKLAQECLCYHELGDCPRGELMYWREIWLERLNRSGT